MLSYPCFAFVFALSLTGKYKNKQEKLLTNKVMLTDEKVLKLLASLIFSFFFIDI
jgi:hypothetical protein